MHNAPKPLFLDSMEIATALLRNPHLGKVATAGIIEVLQLILADNTDGERSGEAADVANGPAASSTSSDELDDGATIKTAEADSSYRASYVIEEKAATAGQEDSREEQPTDNGGDQNRLEAPSDVRQAGTKSTDALDLAAEHVGDDDSSNNEQAARTTDGRIRGDNQGTAVYDVQTHLPRPSGVGALAGAPHVAQDNVDNPVKGETKTNPEDNLREEETATDGADDMGDTADASDSGRSAQSGCGNSADSKDVIDERGQQFPSTNVVSRAEAQRPVGAEVADGTDMGGCNSETPDQDTAEDGSSTKASAGAAAVNDGDIMMDTAGILDHSEDQDEDRRVAQAEEEERCRVRDAEELSGVVQLARFHRTVP